MGRLRVTGIRECRKNLPSHLRNGDLVFITRHGDLTGMLLSFDKPEELSVEVRRELLERFGESVSNHLKGLRVSDRKLHHEFESWRKRRRTNGRRR